MMLDVLYLNDISQAEALFKPRRVDILRRLAEPQTCTEIGKALDEPPQKIYYHVKRLEVAGLVGRVAERRVRGASKVSTRRARVPTGYLLIWWGASDANASPASLVLVFC